MAAAFGGRLREAGVPVSVDQLGRFVRGVVLVTPVALRDLRLVGRATLVVEPAHLAAFDGVFDQVFGGVEDWADSRGDLRAPIAGRQQTDREPPLAPLGAGAAPAESAGAPDENATATAGDGRGGEAGEREVALAVASAEERLSTTDFAELTSSELAEMVELMRRVRISIPLRRARRRRRDRHGDRLDLRATLRASRRSGGDPVDHVVRSVRSRPRRLVVLCDISGSMAPYSRACIQLLHAAAGSSRAEVFTFATRLTRLTRALAVSDPDTAMRLAGSVAPDWASGTRIGAGLKEFLDDYGRRGLARGAVVVVVSDGWDRGDPALVEEQMARLGRLAHRIVWINPRRSAPGFAPLAGGMAAALPYCDALVGGSTLATLADAMGALGGPA